MAQRYFSVNTERSAKKVALLCSVLFLLGSSIWFIPPMAMRVIYPDLAKVMPRFANPHEAAFVAASLTLLPNGLIGIMLAAMFSSAMASLSGMFNLHSAILSKDVFQTLFAPQADERAMLRIGRITTAGVAVVVTILAVFLAVTGKSIFSVMVTFTTIISLAYGPPAMLGLVIKKTPRWSGIASFLAGLAIGAFGTFLFGWGLVMNVSIVGPVSVSIFLVSRLFDRTGNAQAERRDKLFVRLSTPVDVNRELAGSIDQTTRVFRFFSRATGSVGLLALLLLFTVPASGRGVVICYSGITLIVAFALTFIRGEKQQNTSKQLQATDHLH
jgi:Na+/proline symporter